MISAQYDVIGIGFGPSNIAVAIALEEIFPTARVHFFEAKSSPHWQADFLLDGSDIQNHPLRDLVTPRNPRSQYTFINYLFEHKKLFSHLNVGFEFPLRKEYAHYVQWCAKHFDTIVEYNKTVTSIDIVNEKRKKICEITTQGGISYTAKAIILAPGRTPYIPQPFDRCKGRQVIHASKYLSHIHGQTFQQIAIIGGSQTAVELILDLSSRYPKAKIDNYIRSFSYRLKDTSPFSEEVYFPEFIDYYYHASDASKKELIRHLVHTNYSSVDGDILKKLYMNLYEQKLNKDQKINIINNTVIVKVKENANGVKLTSLERHKNIKKVALYDLVVLATGYKNTGMKENEEPYPPLLEKVRKRLKFDVSGKLHVGYDYQLVCAHRGTKIPPIFLNGLCETSHGMGDAGSFSLLALRSEKIVRALRDSL